MSNISQWLSVPGLESWVIKVFIVVCATLVVSLVSRVLLSRLRAKAQSTANTWDDVFVTSIGSPLRLLIWVMGLNLCIEIIQTDTQSAFIGDISVIRDVGIVIAIAWFFTRFIKRFEKTVVDTRTQKGEPVDQTAVEAIAKLIRLAVIITASLVILQTMGIGITGVLTFGGVGGIAIGFAAKDLLSNFFGGLMIYLDRPFSVGDWIRSPDRKIEGTVEVIGWRMTRIRNFDSRPLYVPNASFSTITIENPSRMDNRKIYEVIGIRYEDASAMRNIVTEVTSYLRNHPEIEQNQTLMVNFTRFADSSLDFFIYCFTKTTKWAAYTQVKQEVLLQILEIIESHGAQCAFPTRTVHLNAEAATPPPGKR